MKTRMLTGCALAAALAAPVLAQKAPTSDAINPKQQIAGPESPVNPRGAVAAKTSAQLAAWLHLLQEVRIQSRDRYGLTGAEYEKPELRWTQSSYVQPQMMIHDRYFYDPVARRYTVDRYLKDLQDRYGGIDSVLIWHGYPNIGIDNRNQYDLFNDQPGGVDGVRQMIADFHRARVRVFYPIYAWDQGTRRTGAPLAESIAKELAAVGADGINGDTLVGIPTEYRTASERTGHPLALEPEDAVDSLAMLEDNTMSWGYWKYDFVPSVSLLKWQEPRHMVNICERWVRDHTPALQEAFFNGVGFESWENVWGIWNGLTPRDGESLRRIAAIERASSALLVSSQWVPHAPMEQFGVFASKWPGTGQVLWTIVNRNDYGVDGRQLATATVAGARYFDLWHGVELKAEQRGPRTLLSFPIESDGYGAILQTAERSPELDRLLAFMAERAKRPLASYSAAWKALPQQLVAIVPTAPSAQAPEGMVKIPAISNFRFRVHGVEIEGKNFEGTDVQYPWEGIARRYHDHAMAIPAFWIDRTPVTNRQFKAFVDAAHYHPADDHNFLRDWNGGTYPDGWSDKPVTWVSLEDARAYAQWAGKRLPREWEWQYAAQGNDSRRYPWGNEWNDAAAPDETSGTGLPPPSDVTAHPGGASPFGVLDLVGNVWQWTDESIDEHTRAAVLRGGSHYRPAHSQWYFPQAKELDEHGKLLLMAPSIDRAATLGFRCVRDAEQS